MGWFPDALASHGDRAALLTEAGTITYAELAERVRAAGERLGPERRLVLLAGANHPDAVVFYLAALAGGHPLILAGADSARTMSDLMDAYEPDVVVRPIEDDGPWEIDERRKRTCHELNPELALLLSTSGSTGSPKLVRLSRANLTANAESIASYLAITETDRAVTSLPLAYCYGLSVINSHLQRGASVVLTRRSVIEPEFWSLLRRTRATSFAGVPYTFDLLDRIGFAEMNLPDLRYVTQAGGRLDPERVRAYAKLGRRRGWDLYVMYGQTEATARMTYLPPALAESRPDSIGLPVPGGSIELRSVAEATEEGVGELIYRGPNVMLGYADAPADLALGRSVHELRTGDLARRGPDGLYEIVGRRADFVKIAGLRVDPHGVERLAERHGVRACAIGTDEQLVIVTEPGARTDLPSLIRESVCLPAGAVRFVTLTELPRLPNGKLDRAAVRLSTAGGKRTAASEAHDAATALRDLYASALGTEQVDEGDSFATLGGDSLSYVEITLGLEDILGRLPEGWESMSLRELGAQAPSTARGGPWWSSLARWRSIETSVALRALAIVLIVATHIGMVGAAGGAHVLMAVAGYNFARFRLTTASRAERLASQLRAVARIAVPAMLWVGLMIVLLGEYELRHLLLINALVKDELWGNLWFIELLVYIGLAMAALLAVPAADRAERRWPFGVALAVLAAGLLFRFELLDLGVPYTKPVLWLFALGWAASRAERPWQRGLILAIAVASVPGYFDSWERNAIILGGLVLLIGVPRVAVPGAIARVGGVLAGASMYIYLVHWEVWPMFQGWYGMPSLVASLAAGIGLWHLASRAPRDLAALRTSLMDPALLGTSAFRRVAEGRPR